MPPPPGALLIHGFTATPRVMDSLAHPLRTAGFEIEIPLLTGHGRTVQVLFQGWAVRWLIPFLGRLPGAGSFPPLKKKNGPSIADPVEREKFIGYGEMPIVAINEIVRLQRELRPQLKKITAPVLLIHSRQDTTAPYDSMDLFKNHLGSPVIETVTLERSNHVLTLDYDKEIVAKKVLEFFLECEKGVL